MIPNKKINCDALDYILFKKIMMVLSISYNDYTQRITDFKSC